MSRLLKQVGFSCASAIALVVPCTVRAVQTTAESVVASGPTYATTASSSYPSVSYGQTSAPTGLLTGDTGYGSGLNPFSPPYDPSQVYIAGGTGVSSFVVLKLGQAVQGSTGKVGVFSNSGISNAGTSEPAAGTPAQTLGQPSVAIVSVASSAAGPFKPLFNGQPVTFDAPTNYYLDAPATIDQYGYVEQGLGTKAANQFQPFDTLNSSSAPPDSSNPADPNDPLNRFSGATYDQMVGTNTQGHNPLLINILDGSAGGTWFDLSASGLDTVQYIRFDVPAGDRMAIDSISAVPEPATLFVLALTGALTVWRRR